MTNRLVPLAALTLPKVAAAAPTAASVLAEAPLHWWVPIAALTCRALAQELRPCDDPAR